MVLRKKALLGPFRWPKGPCSAIWWITRTWLTLKPAGGVHVIVMGRLVPASSMPCHSTITFSLEIIITKSFIIQFTFSGSILKPKLLMALVLSKLHSPFYKDNIEKRLIKGLASKDFVLPINDHTFFWLTAMVRTQPTVMSRFACVNLSSFTRLFSETNNLLSVGPSPAEINIRLL